MKLTPDFLFLFLGVVVVVVVAVVLVVVVSSKAVAVVVGPLIIIVVVDVVGLLLGAGVDDELTKSFANFLICSGSRSKVERC